MLNQLAAVQWRLGQTLQPEHLKAQELALLTNTKCRFDGLGKPYYGVLQLSFDESDLMENAIRLTVFNYILESGELIQLGGNATLLAGKDAVALSKDKVQVDLRLNIYQQIKPGSTNNCITATHGSESEADRTVQKDYYLLALEAFPSADSAVPSVCQQDLQLIAQVKLAEYVKDPQLNWVFNEHYLPPTLQVNRNPLFRPYLTKITLYIDAFLSELEKCFTVRLSKEQPVRYSQISQLLVQLYPYKQMLDCLEDADAHISAHPFELFSTLLQLYSQVHLYRSSQYEQINEMGINTVMNSGDATGDDVEQESSCLHTSKNIVSFKRPVWQQFKYRHKALGPLFFHLLEAIKRVIYRKEFDYQTVKLNEMDGIYSTELPIINGAVYYLAVWNEDQQFLASFNAPERATSRTQVPSLTTNVSPGIRFDKVTNNTAIQNLNEALNPHMPAIYFEIIQQGQWLQVVQDQSLGFYGQNAYRNSQFFIVIETSHNAING